MYKNSLPWLARLAALAVVMVIFASSTARFALTATSDSGLSYTETTEVFSNPDSGFYKPLSLKLDRDTTTSPWTDAKIASYAASYGVLHFRFGLEAYSSKMGGQDIDITAATQTRLTHILTQVRQSGATAIVRFSYDMDGVRTGGAYHDSEPALDLIERHIATLGEVLADNSDVIAGVESGMIGPWGEQHSTPLAKSGVEPFFRVVEAWLRALPASRGVTVRRPRFVRYWANRKFGWEGTASELTADNMSGFVPAPGTDAYRVGVFNDGYLGSATDLGTFDNRAEEVEWLNDAAAHTLYGGEVAADSQRTSGALGDYNQLPFLEEEAFRTHTSYLNTEWNNQVIAAWKNLPYTGPDTVYAGQSLYTFVANRLGYRFVLRDCDYETLPDGAIAIAGAIENVGFGQVVNPKTAWLVATDATRQFAATVPLNWQTLASGQTGRFRITLRLPAGDYRFYLKITDPAAAPADTRRAIRFANVATQWNAALGANSLGGVTTPGGANTLTIVACESWSDDATPQPLTVTFRSNDGTGNTFTQSVEAGAELRLPENPFTRAYYRFLGWSDGTLHQPGTALVVGDNLIFDAVWEKQSFTVTFSGNGGTLTSGVERQTVAALEAAIAPVYVRSGYTFTGFTGGDYSRVTRNLTLTATWQAISGKNKDKKNNGGKKKP